MTLRTSALALWLLASAAFAGEPNTLSPQEKDAGWKLLFDGKSTAGWQSLGKTTFPDKGWTVIDGTLHHAKAGGGGDIVTEGLFRDFELSWEWKIGQVGNSGLKYNLPDSKKGVGFEYQLIDDEKHPDGNRGGAKHQTASLYDVIPPAPEKLIKPVGDWNESRILVSGNHVEHWVNGVKTVTFEMGSNELAALVAQSKFKGVPGFGLKQSSPILLQDHGDEVTFRSVKLRELPAKP